MLSSVINSAWNQFKRCVLNSGCWQIRSLQSSRQVSTAKPWQTDTTLFSPHLITLKIVQCSPSLEILWFLVQRWNWLKWKVRSQTSSCKRAQTCNVALQRMEISVFHEFLQKMSAEQTHSHTQLTEIYAAQTTYNVLWLIRSQCVLTPVLTAVHLWWDHAGQMLIPGVNGA